MARPAIPKEIHRAVLIEAGHRCAIPACGHTRVHLHHIVPWATCQKHEYQNLIALCPNCHTRVHDGEIDRISLIKYKSALASAIRDLGESAFTQPIVEIKRRIYSVDPTAPDIFFDFEFPDFCNANVIIASKNIEAWGTEQLEWFNSTLKESRNDAAEHGYPFRGMYLSGRYEVCRRDSNILSLRYIIDGYLGGAHGYRDTRSQNFMLNPFSPLTLDYLLADDSKYETLSELLRTKIFETYPEFPEDWVLLGTTPSDIAQTTFVVQNYCLVFIFAEYQISGYASGSPEILIDFDELDGIAKPEVIAALHSDY